MASCWQKRPLNYLESLCARPAWAILPLVLLAAPGPAAAAVPITAASLNKGEDRTRVVIESQAPLRFSLLILRYPNRVVLEIENVTADSPLARLPGQLAGDHPYIQHLQVKPSPSSPGAVRLEFALKGEAEPAIRAFKPEGGRGHRLVLDIVGPGGAVAVATPAVEAAPPPAPPVVPPPAPPQVPASPGPAAPGSPQSPVTASATPATPATPARARLPGPRVDDPDLVLLELRLDEHVLADALTAYQHGRETFLPLGELAKLLTLAVKVQPERGTAEGFVLTESRPFRLDVAQARLALGDQTLVFDAALVRVHSDDIYVESALLSRWLPLDFRVDLSALALHVRAREPLPLQARLERERQGNKSVSRSSYEDPGYPRHELPYRLLGVPAIDQTLGIGLKAGNGSRQTSAGYTAYLTGDLLGMESALYVSSTKEKPSPDVRFTLARHDPDAGLLGPMRARSVMFGSGVAMPSVTNIAIRSGSGDGHGLMLSNRPLSQPLNFDRHTLQGDLPPGWDVELYFNDALVGFQSSRPDGRYSFEDQPLTYGPNEFRLVFHGPLGQQRVERQSFPLDQSSTPAGAVHYNLVQHQDGAGGLRSLAQVDWGLTKAVAATAGLVRLPVPEASPATGPQIYSNVGLRVFWQSIIANSDFVRSPDGGWLNESGFKTRLGGVAISYNRTLLHDFSSEWFPAGGDPLRTRDKLRLDGALPAAGFLPRLPATLEIQRDELESGRSNLALTGRVSAYVNRTAISNQVAWQSTGGASSASGVLQLSRRVGDIGLSGQLGYSLEPQSRLETIALSGDKRLGEGYLLNLGLVRALTSRETLLTASLNKSLGRFGLGLAASYSSHGTAAVGLQFFMAMGREPRQGEWRFDALPKADSGMVSARVFLDSNANGVMDSGEEPIENVALVVNGSRAAARTNAGGVAWLDRLPTRQHVDIALDTQTLEDPYWAPLRKGVRVVPRPGQAAELDFPVVLTSEIDGTVYLLEPASRRGIGDVVIELLDMKRKVLSAIKTGSDGYYIVPSLVQGRYYLRISPRQLRQFDLIDPGMREVTIAPDGKFVNGVDFVLIKESHPGGHASRR